MHRENPPTSGLMVVVIFALLAFAAGWLGSHVYQSYQQEQHATVSEIHTCPMHPHISEHGPGRCPICNMELVRARSGQVEADDSISIDPVMINNLGVKLATAERGTLYRQVHAYGYVQQIDEGTLTTIDIPFTGTVEAVAELERGDSVNKGDHLLTLSSSDWVELQQAYIDAKNGGGAAAIQQASQQIFQLGLTPEALKAMMGREEADPVWEVRATENAILATDLPAVGDRIEARSDVVKTTGSYPIIAYAEVFEGQWRWLSAGQDAHMRVRSIPGVTWRGKVLDIEDIVTARSRTIKIRIGYAGHEDIAIRSGMHADITLFADPRDAVLRVPRDALIRGRGEPRVILALGDGRFAPRTVIPGLITDEWAEITSGLEPGDEVVVSGQFLLDSESNLANELQRMSSRESAKPRED